MMANRELMTEIEDKIDELRNHMMATAQLKGLHHPDTLKRSQDLDTFLNKYEQIKTLEKTSLKQSGSVF